MASDLVVVLETISALSEVCSRGFFRGGSGEVASVWEWLLNECFSDEWVEDVGEVRDVGDVPASEDADPD